MKNKILPIALVLATALLLTSCTLPIPGLSGGASDENEEQEEKITDTDKGEEPDDIEAEPEEVTWSVIEEDSIVERIYSDEEVNDRVAEIQDYYYNKKDLLGEKEFNFETFLSDDPFELTMYYIDNEEDVIGFYDYLFAFGKNGDDEIRLYFDEYWLVQMIVTKPDGEENVYRYDEDDLKSTIYDEDMRLYFEIQSFYRKMMANPRDTLYLSDEDVRLNTGEKDYYVTGIDTSNAKITFMYFASYGSDGVMSRTGVQVYEADISPDCLVINHMQSLSDEGVNYKDFDFDSYDLDNGLGFIAVIDTEDGVVTSITLPMLV